MNLSSHSIYIFLSALFGAFYAKISEEPDFISDIGNVTVPTGRNVKLSCSVKNLGLYKVAWMHFEQSAILTVQNHVITRNPRISMSHDRHTTWSLHIENVQEEDKGSYMCQINTVVAKTKLGYLNVVVPPDIDNNLSSSDVIVREGSNVNLTCHATGKPPPVIKWRKEDGNLMFRNKNITEKEGEVLELIKISRLDMGDYLCIANNSVQPAVSKKIKVSVDFPPMLVIPHQLVGAPLGSNVTLECITEAHPASLNYWAKNNATMIHDSGNKYKIESEEGSPVYKTHMKLHIRNITAADFGTYKCIAKNPRGETDGTIRLYANHPPTTSPLPTTSTTESLIPVFSVDPLWALNGNGDSDDITGSGSGFSGKGSKYPSNNINEIGRNNQKHRNKENKMSQTTTMASNFVCSNAEASRFFIAVLLAVYICSMNYWR